MIFKKILVIYPEVEFTKIAVYHNKNLQFLKIIRHKKEDLAAFKNIIDQQQYRSSAILEELNDNEIMLTELDIIMARGGLIKPVGSGIFEVNELMKADLREGVMGIHETNLGGLVAADIAEHTPNAKAYLADPVVVDELSDVARITGHPLLQRKSVFHALNQKFLSKEFAKSINKRYEELNLIVVYVGTGGVSIGAHKNGKVIDVNQAFDGGGPFSLTRTGTLPVGGLIDLCFGGKYTKEEVRKMVTSEGGLKAYIGTSNITEVEDLIDKGDKNTEFILFAMAYQVAKEIGSMCTVLESGVDAIILMGSIFNSKRFTNNITSRVEKIAPISIFPEVNDMDALSNNGLMLLQGEVEAIEYQ